MKRNLVLLAALSPVLAALAGCGDAADESDDPIVSESDLPSAGLADPAGTPTPALPDAGITDPAATSTAPPPVVGTSSPADPAVVPPTNQDARYQDSVTEQPEVAP